MTLIRQYPDFPDRKPIRGREDLVSREGQDRQDSVARLLHGYTQKTFTTPDNRKLEVLARDAGEGELDIRGFTLRTVGPASDRTAEIYGGKVSGMGLTGLQTPPPLTFQEWATFSTPVTAYLKVSFDPFAKEVDFGDAGTLYRLDDGGTDTTLEMVFTNAGAPSDQFPEINSESGDIIQRGIFHEPIGIVTDSPRNYISGNLGIAFCAPNSFFVFELQ